jgi:hypothetical protein
MKGSILHKDESMKTKASHAKVSPFQGLHFPHGSFLLDYNAFFT